MIPYLVGAAVALAIAGYLFWQSTQADKAHARLVGTETSTTALVAELARNAAEVAGPGSYEELVELEGVAVPGPGGLLKAELSGSECLWHRHKVTRRYTDVYRDDDGDRRTRTREEVVSDSQTKDPFHLRDADGEILLVPTARIDGARKSVSRFEPATEQGTSIEIGSFKLDLPGGDRDGATEGFEYEEWVLLPETRIFVSGEATDRHGQLEVRGPRGAAKMLISTKSEDELLERHSKSARTSKLLAAVAGVAAVVLVVLAVTIGR